MSFWDLFKTVIKINPWGKEGPTLSRGQCFCFCVTSYHKTSRLWTLAQDIILEWEQRKKSRAGGGAPCESRKTCVILFVHKSSPLLH